MRRWGLVCIVLQTSSVTAQRDTRLRRERIIYEIPEDAIDGSSSSPQNVLNNVAKVPVNEDAWLPLEDETFFRFLEGSFSFSMSMSMPSGSSLPAAPRPSGSSLPAAPTPSPTPKLSREETIQQKCGTTPMERSASISNVLSTVSDQGLLADSSTAQYGARVWIDEVDDGILCPANDRRLAQRYVVALVYFHMNGPNWLKCRAAADGGSCDDEEGTRWLDADNECNWFGLGCLDSPESDDLAVDDYYQLSLFELPENGLAGDLPLELFDIDSMVVFTMDGNKRITGPIPAAISSWTQLEFIDIDDNDMTGTIPEEMFLLTKLQALDLNSNNFVGELSPGIGELIQLQVLQLENNNFEGQIPTERLLLLEQLVALTMENNRLTGSVEAICDVLDERRENLPIYLRFLHVDCLGNPPPVECSCCRCF